MKAELATLLAQAEEKLRAAKLLLQGRARGDASSRAYYAAFHAVSAALHVLETATTPGTLVQLPYKWDERDPLDSWEEEEMLNPSLV